METATGDGLREGVYELASLESGGSHGEGEDEAAAAAAGSAALLHYWSLGADTAAGAAPAPGAAAAAVLLIHGLGCTGRDPRTSGFDLPQTRALRRFGTVVAPDLLGHGRSSCPRGADGGEAPYCMASQARVLQQLLGSLGIEQVSIIGHSMGGPIALALAEALLLQQSQQRQQPPSGGDGLVPAVTADNSREPQKRAPPIGVSCVLYSEPNIDEGDCFGSRQG
jgi:pimeloyl-ACP methyl ester carboxylesterase